MASTAPRQDYLSPVVNKKPIEDSQRSKRASLARLASVIFNPGGAGRRGSLEIANPIVGESQEGPIDRGRIWELADEPSNIPRRPFSPLSRLFVRGARAVALQIRQTLANDVSWIIQRDRSRCPTGAAVDCLGRIVIGRKFSKNPAASAAIEKNSN